MYDIQWDIDSLMKTEGVFLFFSIIKWNLSSQRLFYKETEYCGSQYGSFDAEGNSKGFYFKPVITEWPCGSTDT